MTLTTLIERRADNLPPHILAHQALRYEAVRSLTGEQVCALIRTAILDHQPGESFEAAYDRNLDRVVLSRANEEAKA